MPSKIRAKYVPLPSETARIQTHIDNLDMDLSRYYLEIKWLEKALKKLKRQRDILERRRAACGTLLSPIRRLPPEILSQVFSHYCQQTSISFEGFNSSKRVGTPVVEAPALALSHVCSFWRELSLYTPELWSSLKIDLRWHMGYGPIRLFHLFLSYSGTTSLDIQVRFEGYGDVNRNLVVFDSLVELSRRWETVSWECYGAPVPIDRPARSGFPLLTSLSLKYGCLSDLCFFQESNALQYLTLEDVAFRTDEDIKLPFEQLKMVVIMEQYTSQTLFLLEKFSSLETAEIKHCQGSPQQLLNRYAVRLNYLTSLTFSTNDFQDILSRITTPKLISLTILFSSGQYGYGAAIPFPLHVILEFLSRGSSDGFSILEQLRLDRVE